MVDTALTSQWSRCKSTCCACSLQASEDPILILLLHTCTNAHFDAQGRQYSRPRPPSAAIQDINEIPSPSRQPPLSEHFGKPTKTSKDNPIIDKTKCSPTKMSSVTDLRRWVEEEHNRVQSEPNCGMDVQWCPDRESHAHEHVGWRDTHRDDCKCAGHATGSQAGKVCFIAMPTPA